MTVEIRGYGLAEKIVALILADDDEEEIKREVKRMERNESVVKIRVLAEVHEFQDITSEFFPVNEDGYKEVY